MRIIHIHHPQDLHTEDAMAEEKNNRKQHKHPTRIIKIEFRLTLIRPGWNPPPPPSTFRAIISLNFIFECCATFDANFRKNLAYCSEVTQRYVIERRLKIWEFSGFVYKTYGKWLFVLKIHFGL